MNSILLDIALDALYPGLDRQAKAMIDHRRGGAPGVALSIGSIPVGAVARTPLGKIIIILRSSSTQQKKLKPKDKMLTFRLKGGRYAVGRNGLGQQ